MQMGAVKVRDALNDDTAKLDAVPVAPVVTDNKVDPDATNESFEKCVQYHLRHPKSDRRRPDFDRDFYWTHLFPTILQRCVTGTRRAFRSRTWSRSSAGTRK